MKNRLILGTFIMALILGLGSVQKVNAMALTSKKLIQKNRFQKFQLIHMHLLY